MHVCTYSIDSGLEAHRSSDMRRSNQRLPLAEWVSCRIRGLQQPLPPSSSSSATISLLRRGLTPPRARPSSTRACHFLIVFFIDLAIAAMPSASSRAPRRCVRFDPGTLRCNAFANECECLVSCVGFAPEGRGDVGRSSGLVPPRFAFVFGGRTAFTSLVLGMGQADALSRASRNGVWVSL